jgi:hypothetical protein
MGRQRLCHAERVELLGDRALQLGVPLVDRRIDQGDGDALAGGDRVRLLQTQPAQHVLRGVALAGGGGGGGGRLHQTELIDRRRHGDEPVGFEPLDGVAHRHAGRKLKADRPAAQRRQRFVGDDPQAEL